MRWLVLLIALGVGTYGCYEYIRITSLARKSAELVSQSRSFERAEGSRSMLVLGDSTAVGVGASSPQESVPGRVSSTLDASVENYATSGAIMKEIGGQFSKAKRTRYDLIVIQGGANDVVQFKSLSETVASADRLLARASALSDHVILLTAGRVGDAPLLPRLSGAFFNARARALRSDLMALAEKYGALYIDLYGNNSDIFASDPKRYYARDMFHPSSDGYAVWFTEIDTAMITRWPDFVHAAGR